MKILGLFILLILASCGKNSLEESPTQKVISSFNVSNSSNYFSITSSVNIDVFYETGAEPFTSSNRLGNPIWNVLENNLNAIFQYRTSKPILNIPKALSEMTNIPVQNKTSWTADDAIDLYSKYKVNSPTSNNARFYVFFVKGYSSDSNSVIGFSVNSTPIIIVFKDVIKTTGGEMVQKYVEQSTIIHELGHALGLVNNGIPMAVNHQDTAHGNHTTDSDCVMFWQNEGKNDLANFITKYLTSGSDVMWGPEVLNDVKVYSK